MRTKPSRSSPYVKRLAILGSTGSIGTSTLDIVSTHRDRFRITVLTGGKNIALLDKQMELFRPDVVAVADRETEKALRRRIGKKRASTVQILSGQDGIAAAASYDDSDVVISAIVGSAGLIPTLAAVRAGKTIGLANKESLVMAGRILMEEARRHRAKIIPVDSEHSAIFQCVEGQRRDSVRSIILTASGGPFAGKRLTDMVHVTPEEALQHPRWKMGRKITIDSATLMNKGLEVIEAHHLFGLPSNKIRVVIHPQSIVHSIVEFKDGSCIAQLSIPDMRGPIAYALSYPHRIDDVIGGLSLHTVGALTFQEPELTSFPCLAHAYRALEAGGTMPAVLNAANEVAVNAFLRGGIRFTDIPFVIRSAMDRHAVGSDADLHMIMEADRWARKAAEKIVNAAR